MSAPSGPESGAVTKATQTEDDWNEIKADVKKILETVQSLAPKLKPNETERQFVCDPELWGREIRPTPAKLELYVDLLLRMFLDNENEDGMTTMPSINPKSIVRWPSFANKLSLRFPHIKDWSSGYMAPELAAEAREHLLSNIAKANTISGPWPIDQTTDQWSWDLASGSFELYVGCGEANGKRFSPWVYWYRTENLNQEGWPISTRGYGTLCLIKRPIQDRFLDFGLINLTLAYIGRWTPGRSQYAANPGYTASLMYFLGVFAGQWPSRNERSWFSCQHDLLPVGDGFYRYCPQVHLRCFESITALEKSLGASGLRCDRERGQILSDNAGGGLHFFEERRISVFGLVSSHGPLTSRRLPAFYSVLILADLQFKPEKNWDYEWCAGLEGTIAFHAAIFESVVFWQAKWNDVLDNVDDRLRVRLEHTMDPEEIKRWMFDDGFERSKLYVTILQILRIFSECISTTSDDLGLLDGLFMKDNDFPMRNMRPDELRKMRSNWQSVKEFQKQAEESLLGRIMQKTEEVKSLRDGLFNATSLREANLSSRLAEQSSRQTEQSLIEAQRSALMGRYVLVFTVVTILYLPPSFISTVLDMDIFKKDIGQGRWEYKVSVVSVSLLTYLLAFVTIIAADWKGFKRRFSAWWTRLTDKWECFKLFLTVILVAIIPDYWDRIEGMRLQWWNTTSDGGRISDDSRISDESSKSDEIVSKGRIASEGNSPGASSGAAACTQAGHALVDPEPDPKEARSADWKKDLERGS